MVTQVRIRPLLPLAGPSRQAQLRPGSCLVAAKQICRETEKRSGTRIAHRAHQITGLPPCEQSQATYTKTRPQSDMGVETTLPERMVLGALGGAVAALCAAGSTLCPRPRRRLLACCRACLLLCSS